MWTGPLSAPGAGAQSQASGGSEGATWHDDEGNEYNIFPRVVRDSGLCRRGSNKVTDVLDVPGRRFQWWYEKSGFVLIFFSVFVFCLFINQIRFRIILLSSFLFLLCVHSNSFIGSTSSFLDFFERYIFFNKSTLL